MKKLCILFLLVLSTGTARLLAQDTLRFSPHTLIADMDTVVEWSTHTDSVRLKHQGLTNFTGPITFYTGVMDSTNTVLQVQDSVQYSNDTIAAGGSRTFPLTHTYFTAYTNPTGHYRIGNNVIVIWPIINTTGVYCKDTIRDTVYVIRAVGIHEIDISKLFNVYPNPATEAFTVDNRSMANRDVDEVKILDPRGCLVAAYRKQRRINVSDLPRGNYLIEVRFSDGSIGRRKLLLE